MIVLVTPVGSAPVLRQASNLKTGTARAAIEFPGGVLSVVQQQPSHLATMAQAGFPLPASARALVATYRAVEAVKRQADARAQKVKERAAEKVRAKKEKEREEAAEARRVAAEEKEAERLQARAEASKLKRAEAKKVDDLMPGALPDGGWKGEAPW